MSKKLRNLIFSLMLSLTSCKQNSYLDCIDWASDVKEALNDFIDINKNDNKYVVFDFYNTCSIFDVEEQLAIYQLEHMAFAIAPNDLADVLATDLGDLDKELISYTNISYNDFISDICSAYTKLANRYGTFSAEGLAEDNLETIKNDADWQEFATKMRLLYDVIYDNESASVAYPWITY